MPFSDSNGTIPAPVKLVQVSPKQFELLAGFTYSGPDGLPMFTVTPEGLGPTDLTSVPSFFRWFVSPYGRHTLSALLHDCLIDPGRATVATPKGHPVPDRRQADDLFLVTLGEAGVPRIRRYLMWAAVTFSTRLLHSGWAVRLAMLVWASLALAALFVVYRNVELEWAAPYVDVKNWRELLSVLPGPLLTCWLWGRAWLAGLCFGYGSVLLVPPAMLCYAAFSIYWVGEYILNMLGTSSPPPEFGKF